MLKKILLVSVATATFCLASACSSKPIQEANNGANNGKEPDRAIASVEVKRSLASMPSFREFAIRMIEYFPNFKQSALNNLNVYRLRNTRALAVLQNKKAPKKAKSFALDFVIKTTKHSMKLQSSYLAWALEDLTDTLKDDVGVLESYHKQGQFSEAAEKLVAANEELAEIHAVIAKHK